jgi:hypothetical protein
MTTRALTVAVTVWLVRSLAFADNPTDARFMAHDGKWKARIRVRNEALRS